jgi:type IV secretory pathway VirB6-like protein
MTRPLPSLSTLLVFLLMACIWMVFAIDPAMAQSIGSPGTFQCIAARATGTLYDSSASCPTTMTVDTVFSYLVCNMERLASNIMGAMYCGVVNNLEPAVIAMLTFATVIFGIGFTIGVIPATKQDMLSFLLKMAAVLAFATQSDYMIGIAYNFFVTGARDGVALAISGVVPPPTGSATAGGFTLYGQLDGFLAKVIRFGTDYIGAQSAADRCDNAVYAVMAIMAVAFPPMFYIGLMLMFKIAITFMRAVFGYIYAIIGIAFLITLSPFFLSFMLFRETRPLFDKWVGYMASFALQMVIVFAFLAFVVSIDVKHITGSLLEVIVPKKEAPSTTSFESWFDYCTLCEFDVVDRDTGAIIPPDQYSNYISKGKLQCKSPMKELSIFNAAAPENPASGAAKEAVQSALMKFAVAGLLSLFVLAYIVDALLSLAPYLAKLLASGIGGLTYSPQLAGGSAQGGTASLDMPGGSVFDAVDRGFTQGYFSKSDGVSGTVAGVQEAMKRLVVGGGRSIDDPDYDPGMVERFTNFLANPHREGPDRYE